MKTTTMAILTDVTRCIGCEECVAACDRTYQTGSDAPYRWQGDPSDLSSTRWTTLVETEEGRFVRLHCRHCLDPSCAAACPVGALKRTPEGPVSYDPQICMGCRYCMVACPFGMTRYEWNSATPRVRKCLLCYQKITDGELEQPACTAACPTGATIFGEREELLAEARRRISADPDRYIDHIWGKHEIGGTSVLYISDVDLAEAGWPETLGNEPRPELARSVLHTVPYTFFGVAAAMYGVHWTFERRKKVAAAEGCATDQSHDDVTTESGENLVNTTFNIRVIITKAFLWLFVGAATAVAISRYARGLGATTALTDSTPWGLWIGFDVLSGVALAAGGFVIAAAVYIFHLDRYHAFVRPAVLTAFLGYFAVALGLMADLGRPWNIWRMIFFWQPESPLFEVGWCVMLYLTVLALEFVPVVFEGLQWLRPLRVMRHITLLLVIAGIGLSSLHQSSLGTLFLLAQDRMHPLWYSPILPLLFFVSAIGLGLMMVATESTTTSWLYRREGEWPQLRGLTRAAAVVLSLYFLLRIGDLAWRGKTGLLLTSSWFTVLFAIEIGLSVLVPLVLFTLPSTRTTRWGITVGSISGVAGFVLHRADVGGITHMAVTGQPYVPALTEILISVGLVSAMVLIFLFFVERFPVWEEQPKIPEHFTPPVADPLTGSFFGGPWFGRAHLAGLAWIIGVVLGVAILEATTAGHALPLEVPVRPARSVATLRVMHEGQATSRLVFLGETVSPAVLPENFTTGLLLDGDRAGRAVLFDHEGHLQRLGGENSCGRCHHRNLHLDRATPCATCHTDMYRCNDIFDHEDHVERLGANASCEKCHGKPGTPKTRETSTPCIECHRAEMNDCFTEASHPCVEHGHGVEMACTGCHDFDEKGSLGDEHPAHPARCGVAPGYRLAMHVLCVGCHCVEQAKIGLEEPRLTRCGCCHQGVESDIQVESSAGLRLAVLSRSLE